MKKILVPTDFSPCSLNAYKYALKLASTIGAKLTLFHVCGNDDYLDVPALITQALEAENADRALLEMEAYGRSIQNQVGIQVPSHYILDEGSPVEAIVEYAEFMKADIIVMGTCKSRGFSGILDTFLGNVATKVIGRTNRPVLLIPKHTPFKDLHHISYLENVETKEYPIPEELIRLSYSLDFDLTCLHISSTEASNNEIQDPLLKSISRQELDALGIDFHTIKNENFIEELNFFVKNQRVDILAMIHQNRRSIFDRFLGLTIPCQMAFYTKIPLLIMHTEYVAA